MWRANQTDELTRLRVNIDPHSPPAFRCNGPLGNLEEFRAAFDLDPTASMIRNDDDRAKVW
jgi:putative endopeptidase